MEQLMDRDNQATPAASPGLSVAGKLSLVFKLLVIGWSLAVQLELCAILCKFN